MNGFWRNLAKSAADCEFRRLRRLSGRPLSNDAAEYSDAVKVANSRKPLTYVERARQALPNALPPELDKAGMEWDPATAARLSTRARTACNFPDTASSG